MKRKYINWSDLEKNRDYLQASARLSKWQQKWLEWKALNY